MPLAQEVGDCYMWGTPVGGIGVAPTTTPDKIRDCEKLDVYMVGSSREVVCLQLFFCS